MQEHHRGTSIFKDTKNTNHRCAPHTEAVTKLYWQSLGVRAGDRQPHTPMRMKPDAVIVVKSFLPFEQQLPLSWQERKGNQVETPRSIKVAQQKHTLCVSVNKKNWPSYQRERELGKKQRDEFTEAGPPTAVCLLLQRATIVWNYNQMPTKGHVCLSLLSDRFSPGILPSFHALPFSLCKSSPTS